MKVDGELDEDRRKERELLENYSVPKMKMYAGSASQSPDVQVIQVQRPGVQAAVGGQGERPQWAMDTLTSPTSYWVGHNRAQSVNTGHEPKDD